MTADDAVAALERRIAALEQRLAASELAASRARARGDVENVFSRYMHYHNAFEDERIVEELWVRRGTPGVRSQYNDSGVYTDWDAVMAYHRGRPRPRREADPALHDDARHRGVRGRHHGEGHVAHGRHRVRSDGAR